VIAEHPQIHSGTDGEGELGSPRVGLRADAGGPDDDAPIGVDQHLDPAVDLDRLPGRPAALEEGSSLHIIDVGSRLPDPDSLLRGLILGQADGEHGRLGVDGPGHRRVVGVPALADNVGGSDLRLIVRRVRVGRNAGDITDRIQSVHRRAVLGQHPAPVVDRDRLGLLVNLRANPVQPEIVGVWIAAAGDQDPLGADCCAVGQFDLAVVAG